MRSVVKTKKSLTVSWRARPANGDDGVVLTGGSCPPPVQGGCLQIIKPKIRPQV